MGRTISGVFKEKFTSFRVLFIAAILFFACAADASPWPRSKGGVFIETRADFVDAPLEGGGRFERIDSALYTEIGVTNRLLAGFQAAFGRTTLQTPFESAAATGFSDLEGFVQYTVLRGHRAATSIRLAGARPAALAGGARQELAADGADIELRALHGRDIIQRPVKIFITAEAGYRARLGDAADQVRADGIIGIEPSDHWLILLEGQSITSLQNETRFETGAGGADFDIVRFQPSLVWRANERWAVRAGASFEVATRNVAPARRLFLGLWTTF